MMTTARRSFRSSWSALSVCFGLFVICCSGASVADVPSAPSNGAPKASEGTCTQNVCDCPDKSSCAIDCGSVQGCDVDCHKNQVSCTIACRNDCKADCHESGACHVNCGERCVLDCHQTTGACTAKVGINSTVDCHQSNNCEIQCVGACRVDCQATKTCKAVCAVPETCDVICPGGVAPTLCGDKKTKVCPGTSC